MKVLQILSWLVVAAMALVIVAAFGQSSFVEEASAIWALPWGKVTVVDIYTGLLLVGAWIALRERSPLRIGLWWLALVALGNLATGAYVIVALRGANSVEEVLLGR